MAFAVGAFAQTNSNRPVVVVGGSPKPTVTPTPAATPKPITTPTPVVATVQSLFDLQSKIRTTLTRPELKRGSIGIKFAALDSGKVLFEENAEKFFMPASNMKSFTVATALERLTPDFKFVTSVYGAAMPDSGGTVKGGLTIFGRGDVSFSTSFYDRDFFRGLDMLADRIVQSGVKKIDGDLIADETYFSGSALPTGWEWDDLQWYSGAEVSAFPFNDNVVGLSVRPTSVGAPCLVAFEPMNMVFQVFNTCVTTAKGSRSELVVKKSLDRNILEISGSLPAGGDGFASNVTVTRPAELYISMLQQRLKLKGVEITGRARVVGAKEKAMTTVAPQAVPVEIARLESPAFSVIVQKTMKPSQNMYTETILWTLGEQGRGWPVVTTETNPFANAKSTSADRGIFAVKNFLAQAGVAPDAIVQYDGSGLSRHNLLTPSALVQLYTYMAKQSRYSAIWYDALPVGGVDGTLRNRFKGVRTTGNVHAKTGTLDQVSGLSGYVTTAAGERVVFSVLVNGVPNTRQRMSIIDELVSHFANYDGKL